ncbi:MAG: hypothetical protein ACR2RE_29235, partial [Geminicoccaceae bacterium]
KYSPSPTLKQFHQSDARFRVVRGPVGSGKTTAMCFELMEKAMAQEPNPRGVRRTRWLVARNTYAELRDTTMRTWAEVFHPSIFGSPTGLPPSHTLRFKLKDGTRVEAQVLFRSLESEQDIKKLLSLDITGAWLNECREFPPKVVAFLGLRIGRFPPKRDVPATWRGVIGDTNSPDDDHYLAKWEREPPMVADVVEAASEHADGEEDSYQESTAARFDFFVQPPGATKGDKGWVLNPDAENLQNLPAGYYRDMMAAMDDDSISIYIGNLFGILFDGKPVWPTYSRFIHEINEAVEPDLDLPIALGMDYGLTPACAFIQEDPSGRIIVFDEIVTDDMGADEFALEICDKIKSDYPRYWNGPAETLRDCEAFGDPSGDIRSQVDKNTPHLMLWSHGIPAQPAYSNDFVIRRDAVARALKKRADTTPGLVIGPKCRDLRKAMSGGYSLSKMAGPNGAWQEKPNKGKYSHIAEALQYVVMEIIGPDMLFDAGTLAAAKRDTSDIVIGSSIV